MKRLPVFVMMYILLSLSSCQAIEGIFKAGVWVGVLAVVAVIALIIFIFAKVGGK